jgi:hypothetical protein
MGEVKDAVAAPLEHLDLIVEPFHKATVVSRQEIIGDFFLPLLKRVQEAFVTTQSTGSHFLLPSRELLDRHVFGERGVENVRQLLPIRIRL